jgi:hypothetical protein
VFGDAQLTPTLQGESSDRFFNDAFRCAKTKYDCSERRSGCASAAVAESIDATISVRIAGRISVHREREVGRWKMPEMLCTRDRAGAGGADGHRHDDLVRGLRDDRCHDVADLHERDARSAGSRRGGSRSCPPRAVVGEKLSMHEQSSPGAQQWPRLFESAFHALGDELAGQVVVVPELDGPARARRRSP